MKFKMLEKGVLLIKPDGELDHHRATGIKDRIDAEIEKRNAKHIVWDFSGISFMDSSGIGVIIGRYKTIKTKGGKVFVIGADRCVKRIMEMSGLGRITKIVGDINKEINKL